MPRETIPPITFSHAELDEVEMHLGDALARARDRLRQYQIDISINPGRAGCELAMRQAEDQITRIGSVLAKFDAVRRDAIREEMMDCYQFGRIDAPEGGPPERRQPEDRP